MNRNKATQIYTDYLSCAWPYFDGTQKIPVRAKLLQQMQQFTSPKNTLQDALDAGQNVLWWSDQHFYHEKIIGFCDRPFDNAELMNRKLVENYFDTVKEGDIVVWGGDCAFGLNDRAKDFARRTQFPGYKILIVGNHDFEKGKFEFRDLDIFDEILFCDGLNVVLDGKPQELIVSHYPIDKSLLGDALNLHGHIHEKKMGLPHINMSVEVIDYRPQTLEECLRYEISSTKRPTPK